MATVNDEYQDMLIRRSMDLQRFANGAATRAIRILNEAEGELEAKLRKALAKAPVRGSVPSQVKRLEALLKSVRDHRAATFLAMKKQVRGELTAYAADEVAFTSNAFLKAAGLAELSLAIPVASAVRSAVLTHPFVGGPLNEWFGSLERADRKRLTPAVRMGVIQGESVDDMVRRIRVTKALKYTDGILQTTRREAEAVVRTGVNHATNTARDAVFGENSDIFTRLKWSSVLDGRTTLICANRDGRVTPDAQGRVPEEFEALDPPDARPPAHVNCRSTMVAILDAVGIIGNRPFVTDTRTRSKREIHFRKEAAAKAGPSWKEMTDSQRRRATGKFRREWSEKRVGQVPTEVRYEDFLRRQSSGFQDEWLGATRGKLFRDGKLSLDKFMDHNGKRYNLNQLRTREASAFREANLTTA